MGTFPTVNFTVENRRQLHYASSRLPVFLPTFDPVDSNMPSEATKGGPIQNNFFAYAMYTAAVVDLRSRHDIFDRHGRCEYPVAAPY
jgi:hypothetical protein